MSWWNSLLRGSCSAPSLTCLRSRPRQKNWIAAQICFPLARCSMRWPPACAPFRGESAATIFDGILNRQPVPATRTNSRLPAGIDGIIDKALEKDRELRYQHASDLRADLQRLQRDPSATSPGPVHKQRALAKAAQDYLPGGDGTFVDFRRSLIFPRAQTSGSRFLTGESPPHRLRCWASRISLESLSSPGFRRRSLRCSPPN